MRPTARELTLWCCTWLGLGLGLGLALTLTDSARADSMVLYQIASLTARGDERRTLRESTRPECR